MQEAARIEAVLRWASWYDVRVADETVARGLTDWPGCWLEYRAGSSSLDIHGLTDEYGSTREGWDSRRDVAWAVLPGVSPLDLLDGMRLFGWAQALEWLEACADRLKGTAGETVTGPVSLWAEAIAHLGRALRGWGPDSDMEIEG